MSHLVFRKDGLKPIESVEKEYICLQCSFFQSSNLWSHKLLPLPWEIFYMGLRDAPLTQYTDFNLDCPPPSSLRVLVPPGGILPTSVSCFNMKSFWSNCFIQESPSEINYTDLMFEQRKIDDKTEEDKGVEITFGACSSESCGWNLGRQSWMGDRYPGKWGKAILRKPQKNAFEESTGTTYFIILQRILH